MLFLFNFNIEFVLEGDGVHGEEQEAADHQDGDVEEAECCGERVLRGAVERGGGGAHQEGQHRVQDGEEAVHRPQLPLRHHGRHDGPVHDVAHPALQPRAPRQVHLSIARVCGLSDVETLTIQDWEMEASSR